MSKCMQLAGVGTHNRRTLLKLFAIREFRKSNRCQILVSIVTYAVVRWTPTVGQLGTENKLRTESSS